MKAVKSILLLMTCMFAITFSSCTKEETIKTSNFYISIELTDQGSLTDAEAGVIKQGLLDKRGTFEDTESGAIAQFDKVSIAFEENLKAMQSQFQITKRIVFTMKMVNKDNNNKVVKEKEFYLNVNK